MANIGRSAKNGQLVDRMSNEICRRINNSKSVTFPFLLSSQRKTTTMQKKYMMSLGFIAALLVASAFLLTGPTPQTVKKEEPTCCKKNSKCPSESKAENPANLETLSNQFIAIPVSFH